MRKSWSLRGQQAQILLSGYNARRVIFGGLELRTGERLFVTRRRQQASDFAQWLLRLRQNHPGGELAVLLDENSCHTCAATRKLAQRLNVLLIFLPKRSPHLNPADHLWRWAKGTLCANRQDPDLSAQAERFVLDLRSLPSQTALRLAGVLSKRFWLRRVLSKLF
jgi:transposase